MPYNRYPYELPPLSYPYDSLAPYIDEETMHYHHDAHFQTYVNHLNNALRSNIKLQQLTLTQLLRMPKNLPIDVKRNAGGVYNHTLYFDRIAPVIEGGHEPIGDLLNLINRTYQSFDRFKELFSQQAMSVFGSGYTFLTLTPKHTLKIGNKPNQDTPLEDNETPLMTIDVWEHAYYLGYRNLRSDYIDQIWNVVTFPEIHI